MPSRAQARHHQLTRTLRNRYGHLEITGLREIGHGLEARVSEKYGPAQLATPSSMPRPGR
jgi:hypothetical protein